MAMVNSLKCRGFHTPEMYLWDQLLTRHGVKRWRREWMVFTQWFLNSFSDQNSGIVVALQPTFKTSAPSVCRGIIQKMSPPLFLSCSSLKTEVPSRTSTSTVLGPGLSHTPLLMVRTRPTVTALPCHMGATWGRQHAWEAGVRLQGCFSFAIFWL